MDLNFKKNNIDKDHPDFVYDKEVDFSGEKKTSGWDSETSEDEGILNYKLCYGDLSMEDKRN